MKVSFLSMCKTLIGMPYGQDDLLISNNKIRHLISVQSQSQKICDFGRWILSSIFDKGDTELVDITLPFAGKSRWYNSLMPWKTKAEPWFDGKLIRKIGERLTQIQCPQGRHSSLTLRLYCSWSGYLPCPYEHLHWRENVRGKDQ